RVRDARRCVRRGRVRALVLGGSARNVKILIPLKQVPDSTVRVKVAPDGTSIVTEGISWSISPYDEYAIEMALERKDADPTTVVAVVTVGAARSRDALRQALAMGCDEASLITADTAASLPGIMKAKKKEIPEKALSALGIDASGPTWTILSMEPPPVRGGGKILKDGDAKQIAEQLATALRDEAKVL